MSNVADTPVFSEQEFESIKAAVMETDRGRQFLKEFAQRNRVADTATLLEAIQRLEHNLKPRVAHAPATENDDDLHELALAIHATGEDICAVRNDMLKDTCEIADRQAVFTSLSNDATEISKALIATAEALQKSIADLRAAAPDNAQAEDLDTNVNELFETGWRQDVLAQRITKAMRLLTHLQQNLGVLSGGHQPEVASDADEPEAAAEPQAAAEPELTDANKQYFAQDEELFNAEAEIQAHRASAQPHVAAEVPPAAEPSPPAPLSETEPAQVASGDETEPGKTELQDPATNAEAAIEPKIVVVRAGCKPEADAAEHFGAASTTETPDASAEVEAEFAAGPQEIQQPPCAPVDEQPQAKSEPAQQDAERRSDVMQAFSEFADAAVPAPDLPEAPQPEFSPDKNEKERIVVIRKGASEKFDIPFADYLGLGDDKQDAPRGS